MPRLLRRGDQGAEVTELQKLLRGRGHHLEIDGIFGTQTYRALRAFQSQNLDQHGQPLVVDGKVGPLTWWSLTHPKPDLDPLSAVDFTQMPPPEAGGSQQGRAALAAAIGELTAGACEIGGNNRGEWVRKYLHGMAEEGESWCAAFVSWCFSQNPAGMPFPYTLGARDMLNTFRRKGWARPPQSGYEPQPGDIVVWWRERAEGWKGHVGLVHQEMAGMLYTIEGNRSPRVQGFSYVMSRMEKLLGFGQVADS